MILSDFTRLMKKLTEAFDRKELSDEKREIYFQRFKYLDEDVFSKMVEAIIDEEEKLPTVAKIMSYKRRFGGSIFKPTFECPKCAGGFISAKKDNGDGHLYAFRCDCVNSKRLSDKIPVWPMSGFTLPATSNVINPKGANILRNLPKPDPKKEEVRERSKEFYNPSTGETEFF